MVCPLSGSTDPEPTSEASPVANAPSGAQTGPGWDREGQNQNFDFFLNPASEVAVIDNWDSGMAGFMAVGWT